MSKETPKLLIIGWDGATFDVIDPLLARGELPHLAGLIARGVRGRLRSTVPPSSAVAWPTFATGRDPAGHGVFGFYQTETTSYQRRLVSSRDVHAPCLWDWLGAAGLRAGVVNVPVTYPPRPMHGFLVSGMLTPSPQETFTYPTELGPQLLARQPAFPIESQVMHAVHGARSRGELAQIITAWTDAFHANVCHLLAGQDWDCFVVVYRATDIVQHGLGLPQPGASDGDEVQQTYRQIDACLGALLARVPADTNVVLVSDHGAGPAHGRFMANNWLYQRGYLRLRRGAGLLSKLPAWRRVPLQRALNRLRLGALARRLPPALATWPAPAPRKRHAHDLIDWRRTRVFIPTTGVQGLPLRLNLAGREPLGCVRPDGEAQTLLTELARELEALRAPDGQPLLTVVWQVEGDANRLLSNRGPDLLALPREACYYSIGAKLDLSRPLLAGPARRAPGQHRMEGVLVAAGPAIAPDLRLEGARLVDIAPTALHLLGLPTPAEMDGRVLAEALRPEWLASHPPRLEAWSLEGSAGAAGSAYDAADAARVEGALRALGYLE